MTASKYNDISAVIQVIGNVYNHPALLDEEDKYVITDDDFDNDFHKVVFGSIYKLHELGTTNLRLENIVDFLATRPEYEAIFKINRGDEWLAKAAQVATRESFDYYYQRLKKMTLLRAFNQYGINVDDLYDPDNILDLKKKQLQEEWLDNTKLEDIAKKVNDKIDEIRIKYVDDTWGEASQAGEDILNLIEDLRQNPEVGVPLYGSYINRITRGARLKKFYLRSLPTGYGKTRMMIADVCQIGANEVYDEELGMWVSTGKAMPSLFITTEQELTEVQTMMLSFLSCVNEEHILNGKYIGDEYDRVVKAGQVLCRSPIYIEELPDFSLQDIENTIKKNIREHNTNYIFLDYIHTSIRILEEITKRSGGVKLREDNILFMLSIKLKDICNQYGVFVMSATQLNGQYSDSETPDQNLLRGM